MRRSLLERREASIAVVPAKAAVHSISTSQLGSGWLRASYLLRPLLCFELALADDGALDGAVPEQLRSVVSADAECVEAPIELFQHGFAFHNRADSRGGAMNNSDGGADTDLVDFTERQQRFESRRLHPSNHVGRGQHRRELLPPCSQGVFELDTPFHFTTRADGNWFGHASRLPRPTARCHPAEKQPPGRHKVSASDCPAAFPAGYLWVHTLLKYSYPTCTFVILTDRLIDLPYLQGCRVPAHASGRGESFFNNQMNNAT